MAEDKETTDRATLTLFLRALLISVALIGLLLGMRATQELLAPLLLDAVLALLFAPLLRWLERKGLPGWLALLVLTLLLVVFLLILLLVLAISLAQLETRLPTYQTLLIQRLSALEAMLASLGINAKAGISRNIANESTLVRTAITAITGVLSNLVEVLFYVFLLFLMLGSSRSLTEKVRARLADGHPFALHFSAYAQQIQKQYRIQALSNFLCATGITIALLFFRIDFAFLWGFLAFILAFIPNIGLILATLPAVLLALILYGPVTALLIAVIVTLINAAMDNLVTPRFMGSGLNLPILVIFLSFLIWSWVFGLLGALLAVPITLLIRTLLRSRPETRHLATFLEKRAAPARTERGS